MEEILSYIANEYHTEIKWDTYTADLMKKANKIFEREFFEHLSKEGVCIPFPQVYVVKKTTPNAVGFKYNGRYYILIYEGTIEYHKEYLKTIRNGKLNEINENYVEQLIEYTWLFLMFHEYGHIFCGHCLENNHDRIVQEFEADLIATKSLINLILQNTSSEKYEEELKKCFIAIFYFFKDLEEWNCDERYNIKKSDNYYDEKGRDHPLTAERILNIFKIFNVYLLKENENVFYCIKERILDCLFELGEKTTENKQVEGLYQMTASNLKQMEKEIEELQNRIPRYKKEK